MKWYRLKANGCPKCNCMLHSLMNGKLIVCNSKKCNFRISPQRMQEIISEQISKQIPAVIEEENTQELLNNL